MNTPDIAEIIADVTAALAGPFAMMDMAEEEIAAAQKRHPDQADKVWHAFMLLSVGNLRHETLRHEHAYRAHCRELLDRVATGADLRPATAAEVLCLMVDVTMATPITSAARGLYFRMWIVAGMPDIEEITESSQHHEGLEGHIIDDHEADVRRRLAARNRVFDEHDITCEGVHHAVPVTCRYATKNASENASDSSSGNDSDNPPQATT